MDIEKMFPCWAVTELMGHQKIIGYVSQVTQFGAALMCVEVPEIPAEDAMPAVPAYTKLIGPSAIYGVLPCSEEFARALLADERPKVHSYYLPALYPRDPEATSPRRRLLPAASRYVQREQEDFDDNDDRRESDEDHEL